MKNFFEKGYVPSKKRKKLKNLLKKRTALLKKKQ